MDFEGEYRLTRQITHADAPPATFAGRASWSREGDGLRYHESGELAIRGHAAMTAERRYFWAPDLKVYFDDGRFFHQVPPSGGHAAHWCDPDHYGVTYHFDDWPNFQVEWRVTGPKKEYKMHTHYIRTG